MQFSAIFSQFLPRDPGCAALRCTFISQIFYIFYFILLARILDTLDQSRLPLYLVPVCSFMLWTSQCSPPIRCPTFKYLSFYNGCATAPGSYGYYDYLCHFMAPDYVVSAPWQPLLVQLPVAMRSLQLSHQRSSWFPLHCSLLFAALLFLLFI